MGEPKLMRFAQIRPLGSVLGTSFRSPPNPSNENFRGPLLANEKGEDGGNNWYLSRLKNISSPNFDHNSNTEKCQDCNERAFQIIFCQIHCICYMASRNPLKWSCFCWLLMWLFIDGRHLWCKIRYDWPGKLNIWSAIIADTSQGEASGYQNGWTSGGRGLFPYQNCQRTPIFYPKMPMCSPQFF